MKKIIGIVTPILLLILPYLLFVVLSVGMGRPDRDSSGAYIMAGDSRLQMTQTAICIVYVVVVLLNVVWVICQTAAGTSAQTLLLWDMLMKLCYVPYYLLAALMVLAGFATFMFGGVAIIGVMWIADVLFLIPPSIYGLCGCIRACSEKKAVRGGSSCPVDIAFHLCAGRCGGGRRILYRTRQTQTPETDGGCQTAADAVPELNK